MSNGTVTFLKDLKPLTSPCTSSNFQKESPHNDNKSGSTQREMSNPNTAMWGDLSSGKTVKQSALKF